MKQIEKNYSFPFPVFQYTVESEYAEAMRASGVSYILMSLINNATQENETLSEVLKSFDIAPDIHDVFATELSTMVKRKLLTMKSGTWDPDFVLQYPADNYVFTDYGHSMFEKGMYLTGNTKKKRFELMYDPLTNTLQKDKSIAKKTPESLSYCQPIWEDYSDVEQERLEAWIANNQKALGIKTGNQVINSTITEKMYLILNDKNNLKVSIGDEAVKLQLSTAEEQKDFQTYDPETAQGIIEAFNGVFEDANGQQLRGNARDIDTLENVINAYAPGEIANLQRFSNASIVMNRERLFDNSAFQGNVLLADAECSFDLMAENDSCEMLVLDSNGGRRYCLADLEIDGLVFTLLLEEVLSEKEFAAALNSCYEWYCQKAPAKNTKAMINCLSRMGEGSFAEKYAAILLEKVEKENERIDILLDLNSVFAGIEAWDEYLVDSVLQMFNSSLETNDLSEIEYLDAVFADACKIIGLDKAKYYSRYLNAYRDKVSGCDLVEALSNISCEPDSILAEMNVIPEYAKAILRNTDMPWKNKLAKKFDDCRQSFNGLVGLLGMGRDAESKEYEDIYSFDTDAFFTLYSRFTRHFKSISGYSHLAADAFETINQYASSFDQYHQEALIKKQAESNPMTLQKEAIDSLLAQGELNKVIGILYYRLQASLSELLGSPEMNISNMITEVWKQGFISYEQSSSLHKFRLCRNGLQHPFAEKIPFELQDVKEWEDLILSLE